MKVKAKKEVEEEKEEEAISYTEGRLDKAEYDLSGSWASHLYTSEDAARAGCDTEDNCLGYWLQRGSGKNRTLYVGKRSWAAGVPNGSVVSVKVKVKKEVEEEKEEEAISYTEGRLDKAEYDLSGS